MLTSRGRATGRRSGLRSRLDESNGMVCGMYHLRDFDGIKSLA